MATLFISFLSALIISHIQERITFGHALKQYSLVFMW
jgi:hypothetical protein